MKKIIFVHLFNDRSGSPKVLSQVINALYDSGFQVVTMTSRHSAGFLDNVPGVKRSLFYRRSENKILTLLAYLISQSLLFFQCLAYYRSDVVFHVNTIMPFGAALAAKLMGKPVVYHVHECSVRPVLMKRFLRLVIKLTANQVIFVSSYLQKEEKFTGKKQIVLHNALEEIPKIEQFKNQDDFKVLMVCSLKRYKGVDEFLEIAKRVFSLESKVLFTLVLNASQQEINKYFENVEVPGNLKIITRQTNLEAYYSSSSILVNLSRPDECIETFGLTLIEGMSYGLPVIAPPVGGPLEIVQPDKHGYLISCYEIEYIANTIIGLSSDPERYSRLSLNAREHALTFRPEVFKSNIVKFYNRNFCNVE
ncbi:glycosyltransferase family 4 protein [Halomonas citrativorans]|uniref:Glycosyltransferase family 4 protein n=1 Tax=Halomonas citrativorans TaxID=2742612 RepID=A0ABR9FEQ1_9GAMM|nr:glycosyltransferase family 4 protein [Halomonas citrativorans]MBE0404481.1 glycosyltransferase family 4 protein [Halomonas citrativorans]